MLVLKQKIHKYRESEDLSCGSYTKPKNLKNKMV